MVFSEGGVDLIFYAEETVNYNVFHSRYEVSVDANLARELFIKVALELFKIESVSLFILPISGFLFVL